MYGNTRLINIRRIAMDIDQIMVFVNTSPRNEETMRRIAHGVCLVFATLRTMSNRMNRSATKMSRMKAWRVERREARQTPANMAALVATALLTIHPGEP